MSVGQYDRSNLFSKSLIAATLIFAGCLCVGFRIAQHRPLWNDEYYSQMASIYNTSYADQFLGRIPEGGNAPLFYFLQKLFLQMIHYQVPSLWLQGHWYNDASSQILLRINPVIFMSLSVGLVFYYFCRRSSLGTGFLSLFIYLSSHMLWAFWAEARPYALVVFLTTLQSVVFLNMVDQKPRLENDRSWVMLAGTNILLSLTSILGLGEVLAVSVLWWAFKERDWKKYILVTLLPMAIFLFYYAHAPKYPFYFGASTPLDLLHDNISKQCFYIFFIFLSILAAVKFLPSADILKPVPYIIFMALVFSSSAVVLWLFALHAKPPNQGFAITSRYFIYLTPLGVITTTILTGSIFTSFPRHHLIKWIICGLIGFLLAQHFLKTFHHDILPILKG